MSAGLYGVSYQSHHCCAGILELCPAALSFLFRACCLFYIPIAVYRWRDCYWEVCTCCKVGRERHIFQWGVDFSFRRNWGKYKVDRGTQSEETRWPLHKNKKTKHFGSHFFFKLILGLFHFFLLSSICRRSFDYCSSSCYTMGMIDIDSSLKQKKNCFSFSFSFPLLMYTGPLQHVVSVVKGKTNLPCDVTPTDDEDDQASLVLFYKDGSSQSIYT